MANNTIYPFGHGGQTPTTIPIADDLQTDRADVALSAKQGMVLNNLIVGGQTEIDVSSYTNQSCCLGNRTSGWYNYNNLMYHKAIPVSPNERYILTLVSTSSGITSAFYGIVTRTYSGNPARGSTIPFVGDTDRVKVLTGESTTITIPSDGAYIIVNVVDGQLSENTWALKKLGTSLIGSIEKLEQDFEESSQYIRKNTDVAKIFNYYFPGMSVTPDTLSGAGDATIGSSGLSLPVGVGYRIAHNKMLVFDEEEIVLEVSATASDKILCYSSSNSSGAISSAEVNSFILFDFVNGRISIYRAGTINTSTGVGTELVGADFTAGAGNYLITFGRRARAPFGAVYNKGTREYVELTFNEQDYASVNTAIRPAGWMYYYPAFSVLAGSPVFKRFVATAPTNLFVLFQGDSYTQGYAGYYYNCWAKMASDYFGNSLPCGISGGTLANIITQYHDSIKGKVNVQYIVISIGINDMSSLNTDAKINTWAETFLGYVNELVSDGITPIINRIWPEGSSNSSTAATATKMNNKIRSFGYDGADFGAVTGYPNNENYYVSSHLSVQGNKLTYDIFEKELAHYYLQK